MSLKMRTKIKKTFGETMFNTKVKIPIHDVLMASMIMGKENQTYFWNSLIRSKKERDKAWVIIIGAMVPSAINLTPLTGCEVLKAQRF